MKLASLIATAALASIGPQESLAKPPSNVIHAIKAPVWRARPSIPAELEDRIRKIADETADLGVEAARMGFYDIAFPADAAELAKLGGNAVVLVTLFSHNAAELPPSRLYVVSGERAYPLELITGAESHQGGAISKVLGTSRWDGLYLLPILLIEQTADLRVDFPKKRSGFVLGRLMPLPSALPQSPGNGDTGAHASPDALRRFIAREYAGFLPPAEL